MGSNTNNTTSVENLIVSYTNRLNTLYDMEHLEAAQELQETEGQQKVTLHDLAEVLISTNIFLEEAVINAHRLQEERVRAIVQQLDEPIQQAIYARFKEAEDDMFEVQGDAELY